MICSLPCFQQYWKCIQMMQIYIYTISTWISALHVVHVAIIQTYQRALHAIPLTNIVLKVFPYKAIYWQGINFGNWWFSMINRYKHAHISTAQDNTYMYSRRKTVIAHITNIKSANRFSTNQFNITLTNKFSCMVFTVHKCIYNVHVDMNNKRTVIIKAPYYRKFNSPVNKIPEIIE